jgi:hypothetical protein
LWIALNPFTAHAWSWSQTYHDTLIVYEIGLIFLLPPAGIF